MPQVSSLIRVDLNPLETLLVHCFPFSKASGVLLTAHTAQNCTEVLSFCGYGTEGNLGSKEGTFGKIRDTVGFSSGILGLLASPGPC